MRPLFTTKANPDFIEELTGSPYGLIQIPLFLQIANASLDQLFISKLLISVNDPDDHGLIDEIVSSLEAKILEEEGEFISSFITVSNQYSNIEANQKALDLLDLVFYLIIGIMMFLCFFSLQASMTANMYE